MSNESSYLDVKADQALGFALLLVRGALAGGLEGEAELDEDGFFAPSSLLSTRRNS